jgi:cysteine synthase
MSGKAEWNSKAPTSSSSAVLPAALAGRRPARVPPHSEEIVVAKFNTVLDAIGNTPELRINKLFDPRVEVWVKLERQNPGGSIKDRIALAMIEDAEKSGVLRPGATIVEPTSGNTGVGLALVAAVKGYKLILTMPESMSVERRKLMAAYGATFELTPRELGMRGTVEKAQELVKQIPGSWMPGQFENPANIAVHKRTTVEEIARDFPDGLDYIFAGVGTGGHVTAVGEALRQRWPKLQVFAVEPEASPRISGGQPGPHPIQGIGANFIPDNFHRDAVSGVIAVAAPDAYGFTQRAAREEGLLIGISSGAVLAAVAKKLPEIADGARILAFTYDSGERYLSVPGLFDIEPEAAAAG